MIDNEQGMIVIIKSCPAKKKKMQKKTVRKTLINPVRCFESGIEAALLRAICILFNNY